MSKEPRGIYIRVSTEDQANDDKASVPSQKRECIALCERRSYEVVNIYIDNENYIATHGKNKGKMVAPSSKRRDRPEYLRMITDLKAGKIKGVVAWKWDRLGAGSGIYPLMDALEEIQHPVPIETVTEGEISPLMLSMLTAFRAQVLKDMKDRLSLGIEARLESGKFWGGNRLYGYDLVDGQRVINPDEAKWVVLIFEWYTSGVKVREIRRRLITKKAPQKGHKSTKRPWNEGVIRDILNNSAYTGKVIITWDGKPYELEYAPIISQETFEKAQRILERNRTWRDRNRKIVYLLNGMLRCADCGKLWQVKGKRYYYLNGERHPLNKPYRSYRCPIGAAYPKECSNHKQIGAEHLEEAVWGAISEIIRNPEIAWQQIQKQVAELNEHRAQRQREAESLKGKLEKLKEERQWTILQARKGTITQADFEAQIAMMDTEQSELEKAYQEAIQDIPDGLEAERLEQLVQEYLVDCQAKLAWLDNPPPVEEDREGWREVMKERRVILEILVEEVVIDAKAETMRLVGAFDKVVQFNTERLQPDCDELRGTRWVPPAHG